MPAWSQLSSTLLIGAATILSAALTWASIRYAYRRQMIDHPGQRRSHDVPTPRGGGIGIVLAVIAGLVVITTAGANGQGYQASYLLLGSITLVALVGWIDDHRGLDARWRIIAHGAAAVMLGAPALSLIFGEGSANPATPWLVAAWLVCVVALVWSINLHNFMDGIDGLLAMQALFVFCVLAWICHRAGRIDVARPIGLFAAATLGFLPFNFPRARNFMGDVGSGVLGLLVAVAVFWQVSAVPSAFWVGFIACSAFVVDSTATLLSRMSGGRRWYSAHREHLYQWLVRCGMSHVQVVGLYMAWNLVVVLPMIYWSLRTATVPEGNPAAMPVPTAGSGALLAVYALGAVTWVCCKRLCLRVCRSHRSR